MCLLALVGIPLQAQSAGRTITFTSDGVTAFDQWIDLSNPADYVFGGVWFYSTGSAAQPAYQLLYEINDSTGNFFYLGQGSIPASSVTFSGGAITNGKMIVSIDVDTCQLDPTAFSYYGPCGIVKATWTEVPGHSPTGFTSVFRGSHDIYSGSMTQHISGTVEQAVAVAQGTVLGFALTPTTYQVYVGLTRQVTVTTQLP
jgi:hypothetical protein